MGSHAVEEPLQLRFKFSRLVPADQHANPRARLGVNALMGMGLWALLWMGYNTDIDYLSAPGFPGNTADLIHGIRAFAPAVAAWIAGLVIVARANRLLHWISGPLGLMLLYAVVGLASSIIFSPDPLTGLYYGANYLAIVLVMLAVVLVYDPLTDIHNVLRLTWVVGIIITIGLLAALPYLGGLVNVPEAGPVHVRAYDAVKTVAGMSGPRNTGFARYAGISALVALPAIMRKGSLLIRALWAILFATSVYALVIANGRTETLAFVGGVLMIMLGDRSKRTANALITIAGGILLGLRGFYSAFYMYITRTGHLDLTMSGRVEAVLARLTRYSSEPGSTPKAM